MNANTTNDLFYEEKEKNYPTEEELQKIKDWDAVKDPMGLIGFIKGLWAYPDYFVVKGKRVIKLGLHSVGWSGNEDIIESLQENKMFFLLYWLKSTRGGHYFFRIEKIKDD